MNVRPLNLTRCPAPAHTAGGTIRCVVRADACTNPGHARWRNFALPMAVVWWIKPWWPNVIGRAQDRAGRARSGRPTRVDRLLAWLSDGPDVWRDPR